MPRAGRLARWMFLVGLGLVPLIAGMTRAAAAPNIVHILLDDLDVATTGTMTGTMREIAAQGLSLNRSYVTAPLCFPSRAAFFTGRYPHNIDMRNGGYAKFVAADLERATLAPWLQGAGYFTAFVGKYINDYPRGRTETFIPAGWDRWAVALREDFYDYYDYTMNEDGILHQYARAPADYFTDVVARKAVEFIDAAATQPKPLALFIHPSAPHGPPAVAPRHAEMFADATVPRPPSFREANTRDKPPFIRFNTFSEKTALWLDERYRLRLRMLVAADELVAAVVAALQAHGMLDSTYIFVTSDNGYHMGQHNLMPDKATAFDEDIRVPLLVRGPGVPAGTGLPHVVSHLDLAPTILELAGAVPPGNLDGRSLVPLLGSTPPSVNRWRQAMLVTLLPGPTTKPPPPPQPPTAEYGCVTPTATSAVLPEYWAIRSRRYTYVEYATGDRELYDNFADPHQLRNAYCTATAALRDKLAAAVARLRSCSGSSCVAGENVVVDY